MNHRDAARLRADLGVAGLTATAAHRAAADTRCCRGVGGVSRVNAGADNRATDFEASVQERDGVALGLGIQWAVEGVGGGVLGLVTGG